MSDNGWIGVDLDGTLAFYDTWRGRNHIGRPIEPMVKRVKAWLEEGQDVKIFTARVCGIHSPFAEVRASVAADVAAIEAWCLEHIGQVLAVTNQKDYHMIQLWDDRAIQVETNTGIPLELQ